MSYRLWSFIEEEALSWSIVEVLTWQHSSSRSDFSALREAETSTKEEWLMLKAPEKRPSCLDSPLKTLVELDCFFAR